MKFLLPFILFLTLTLYPTEVKQGEGLTLVVPEGYYILELSDNNTYFEGYYTTTINATGGEYAIRVMYSCEPGTKYVYIKDENGSVMDSVSFLVKSVTVSDFSNLIASAEELDYENLKLKRENKELNERIKNLEKNLDSLNTINLELHKKIQEYLDEIEDLRSELNQTKEANKQYKQKIDELEVKIDQFESEKSSLENYKTQAEKNIKALNEKLNVLESYLETFKMAFFFVSAFLIGTYISLIRR